MPKKLLPYINSYRDSGGILRHYFRKRGLSKRTPLPGQPGSREFMDAYQAALEAADKPVIVGLNRDPAGSFGALVTLYYQSSTFRSLKPQTQRNFRFILERFRSSEVVAGKGLTFGQVKVKDFRRAHIAKVMDAKAETPGAAANLLKRLRAIFTFAIEREWIETNPAEYVKPPRPKSRDGFIPWSQAEIDQFCEHWPVGSKPRRALTLLLSTAVRRSDACRLGRQHIVKTALGPELHFKCVKTGMDMAIPIDASLQREIDLMPAGDMMFVTTEYGKPFTDAGFTKWFRERAEMAGVMGRTPHGLRKAAARELAESGSTASEISGVTGHTSIKEVERYTRSANRRVMAWEATNKRQRPKPGT